MLEADRPVLVAVHGRVVPCVPHGRPAETVQERQQIGLRASRPWPTSMSMWSIGQPAREPPPDVIELLDTVAADVRPESVRVALGAMAEANLRYVLPGIAVATLLVWGELDRAPR